MQADVELADVMRIHAVFAIRARQALLQADMCEEHRSGNAHDVACRASPQNTTPAVHLYIGSTGGHRRALMKEHMCCFGTRRGRRSASVWNREQFARSILEQPFVPFSWQASVLYATLSTPHRTPSNSLRSL